MVSFNGLPFDTEIFIGIVVVFAIFLHFFFSRKVATQGPSLLTMVGIFFTFYGISKGLYKFDAKNIQSSIPDLLDGLKTAFFASVFGVAGALTLKMRLLLFGLWPRGKQSEVHGATVDDLVKQMVGLHQAIVGTDDSTLITQIKLARSDSNDKLDAVKRALDDSLKQMADNNSKALIEALKDVMRDFNVKINEQFGDNFKHLNAAVEAILVWQEKYREQMAEMIDQQRRTAANMDIAVSRYENFIAEAHRFSIVADALSKLLSGLELQREQIQGSVAALGQLLVSASAGLPEIEKKIVDFAAQVTRAVKLTTDETSKSIQENSTTLKSSVLEMQKQISDALKSTNDNFNAHVTEMNGKTKEQIVALDLALEKELTKALETMARQLTALSQKFVEDYTPLTDRLRDVISISRTMSAEI